MGFEELNPTQVRENIRLSDTQLHSLVNGKAYTFGRLEIPTVAELRQQIQQQQLPKGQLQLSEVVANVQNLHTDSSNTNAFFQAASQFNLLEMVSPSVVPEAGVGIYDYDRTQGPACAIAAGAGTIYRNYFVSLNGNLGQSTQHQIDGLEDVGKLLGNEKKELWKMQNGYAIADAIGLEKITAQLKAQSEEERDSIRQALRIGVQWDTQVTLHDCQHTVTQAYCSALPVRYSDCPPDLWESFARLVLEASYEASLHAAALNFLRTGSTKVYLTLVGGGVFGNKNEWILDALERALRMYTNVPLDVMIVSYGNSQQIVRDFIAAHKN